MMRTIVAFVLFMFLPFAANAALVIVNDGEVFDFDVANTYQLVGALSDSNRDLAYGVNLDQGESFDFVVTAPEEFDLYALLWTEVGIIAPNNNMTIYAGTSFTFPASWEYFYGYTNWLTIGVGDKEVAIINDVYGGSLVVSSVPEPVALPLMLSGLALIGFMAHRRSRIQ